MQNMLKATVCLLFLGIGAPAFAQTGRSAERSTAPTDASIYIIEPHNGQVVGPHVRVVFGARNLGVAPAGMKFANTGHHHLLVDAPLPPLGEPFPSDRRHLHYGTGETETVIDLPGGRHTLQLVMGDHNHVPHDPPVISKPITIFVRNR
ncbi:MAG: DUF4399 domain-containing protein [Acetobacteraceae bacterium]